jgi:hypothetical protein
LLFDLDLDRDIDLELRRLRLRLRRLDDLLERSWDDEELEDSSEILGLYLEQALRLLLALLCRERERLFRLPSEHVMCKFLLSSSLYTPQMFADSFSII